MAEKKKKAASPPPAKGAEKPPRSGIKLLIIGLIALLLLGGGGFAAYYFLWPKQTDSGEANAESTGEPQAATQPAPTPAAPPPQAAAPPPTLIYYDLSKVKDKDGKEKDEKFIVNLASGQARLLQVGLVVATFNPQVPAALDKHRPRLRNDILNLLATQDFATLNTPEGKEALRESLRQALVRILASSGEVADIRDVLFSDLIMQ